MKKRCSNCFYKDRRFNEHPCLHCIADGNHPNWADVKQQMIIEELEKIKEEIQGLIDFEESCGDTTLGYQCLGVIKDRISELKGE